MAVQERLTIVRPPDLGRRLAVAVHAVCAAPVPLTPAGLALIRARLACGDFESIRDLVRGAQPAPALPLALARYVRWSADLKTAVAAWSTVEAALEFVAGADPALRLATWTELPATATDLGDVQLAARLHALARGMAAGAARPADADPDAKVVCDVAHHLLGLDPDAPRGRLRLRPRLDRQRALDARHIRFGDGSISMTALRNDDAVVIRIQQDAGAIPFTVLLEPIVPHAVRAEVDGRTANLAFQPVDGAVLVPVQLVLDEARTLVVQSADA